MLFPGDLPFPEGDHRDPAADPLRGAGDPGGRPAAGTAGGEKQLPCGRGHRPERHGRAGEKSGKTVPPPADKGAGSHATGRFGRVVTTRFSGYLSKQPYIFQSQRFLKFFENFFRFNLFFGEKLWPI